MDKKTPPLWDQSACDSQMPTREPKSKPISLPKTPQDGQFKKTVLSADAPEFVPSWLKETTPVEEQINNLQLNENTKFNSKSGAQNRLKKYRNQSSQGSTSSSRNSLNSKFNSLDMSRLQQLITSVINYPGQFDDLLMVFIETLNPYFNDVLAMSEIAKLLVTQGIEYSNFRYNGARLCWFVEQRCPTFRADLHLSCKKELQENPNQQNVLLFIAELYTQLPHDTLYGSLLIDAMKKLLRLQGNDNIKCVCQALKLTGYSLEQNHKQALDELFIQLREFSKTVSETLLTLINYVINLRESNWGRSNSIPEATSTENTDFDSECEEMVNGILYETETGLELTNEEQKFLAANANHDEYLLDDDSDELYDPDPEMDEEIQAAFEEFLKMNKS
ncbi:hypothetical protein ABEB36_000840 [Hypothenemus hampei]|uniref:MIF4G domain-containing protein n=1 Tax=Hypothenemus hampei TaxID=57062 RepID=A0ABD1FCL2_HYPHA